MTVRMRPPAPDRACNLALAAFPWIEPVRDVLRGSSWSRLWLTDHVALDFQMKDPPSDILCAQFRIAASETTTLKSDASETGVVGLVGAVAKAVATSKASWVTEKTFRFFLNPDAVESAVLSPRRTSFRHRKKWAEIPDGTCVRHQDAGGQPCETVFRGNVPEWQKTLESLSGKSHTIHIPEALPSWMDLTNVPAMDLSIADVLRGEQPKGANP